MENIHSLPKRSFSSNPNAGFTSHKSVYDDVFGGPPKFGLPTLAPRLEDYSEIFGGFHSSRSSSIPVLDLPLIGHELDLHFDVRSSSLDYNEVFGDIGGLDFTASFEDLFGQSSGGGYDSSDEPWSPAHSGSLSDELDPLAGSDNSHRLSDGDIHQSSQSIKQLNASYNKSSQRRVQTVVAATHHMTKFSAVPGYTFSYCDSPVSWDGEDEHCSIGTIDDINHSKEFAERVREENQYKCSSSSLHSGSETHRSDQNPLEKHGNSTSPRDIPFVTVSDISLRTKPSRLPPPSRPPPVLAVQEGEGGRSNSKLKASKSYAFERVADDRVPLFFDVEINAAISAEDRQNGNNNLKVTDRSTAEPVERKFIRSYSAMQVDEKTNKSGGVSSPAEDEELLQSHGKETTVREAVVEERIETIKRTEATSGSSGLQCSNHSSENSDKAVAWMEATEYFEVVEENISRQPFDIVMDDSWIHHTNRDAHVQQEISEYDTFNLKEDCKGFRVTTEAHRWQEKNQPEMSREHYECGNKQRKEIPNIRMSDRKGSPDKPIPNKLTCAYNVNKKIPGNLLGEFEELQIDHSEASDVQPEAKGNMDEVATELKLEGSPKRMNIEKRSVVPQITKQKSGKHKHNFLREEFQRRLEDVEGAEMNREVVKERKESEGTEEQQRISEKQNENKLDKTYELKENAGILKEGKMHKECGEKSYVSARHDINGDENLACEKDMDAGELMVNELTFREALKQVGNDKEDKSIHERDVFKERNGDVPKTGDNVMRYRMVETGVGDKDEAFETTGNKNFSGDASFQGHISVHAEELKPIESNGNRRGLERDMDGHVTIEGNQLKVFEGGFRVDEMLTDKVLGKHDTAQMPEVTQATCSSHENWELKTEPKGSTCESETGMDDTLAEGRFGESSKYKDDLQDKDIHHASNKTVESPFLPKQMSDANICGIGMGISHVTPSASEYTHEPVKIMLNDDGVQKMNSAQFVSKRIDLKDNFNPSQERRESVINGRTVEDASSLLKHDDALFSAKNATSQRIERKEVYMKDNFAARDQKVGERIRRETTEENIRRETTEENERLRKLEEEREREREREKDRMAVDRAALEACERSYSEARERADKERAAVERATAEARQRVMAEARDRLEKASIEARLRAERAAVERATAEARQRAAEKLMAQKAAYDPNYQVERSIPDRFSASSRSADKRQSYVSSEFSYQSTGTSKCLRSYSLAREGADGESPQRCKARFERYRRTAERAANALAEKNRRDLLAQREREERNRVAEALDAEVKRWSSGKEGNLRALLSTLQYILGPDSGWHPVPLTEVITSAAVKKAYRKATLCVHPDKLQQRGATIQQKYICEKVFDLLKEAWNKFNSEER